MGGFAWGAVAAGVVVSTVGTAHALRPGGHASRPNPYLLSLMGSIRLSGGSTLRSLTSEAAHSTLAKLNRLWCSRWLS